MHVHSSRPFNTRWAIWSSDTRIPAEQRATFRTARCNYLYINRLHGIDDVGPTPDWSTRTDLVDRGRVGPARVRQPALEGIRLWAAMDEAARAIRPGEATLAHCVASLPIGMASAAWRDLIEGFVEDHLANQGMAADWAIHAQVETADRPAILPHAHLLITTRCYDPAHADHGKRRQAWLRTPNAAKSLADKWHEASGLYPSGLGRPSTMAA